MFTTFQRVGMLTAALYMAAGATAFASVTIEPSNSITLQTRVRGMGNSDPDREKVTVTAISHTAKVNITENTCRGLTDVSNYKTGSNESSGSGRPSEQEYYATISINTKSQEGSCTLVFSDGGHSATANIRIIKP
jgi:hypothetical protein